MTIADHFRVGQGFDVHRLVEGRELWLGGVPIPSVVGLLGHSDADVVLHALCDACLGACGLGDIGQHFSDQDPQWKGVSSRVLLRQVHAKMTQSGWELVNADLCIIAQKPALAPFFEAMKEAVAEDLFTTPERINIKATTTEKLGWAGREEGIGTHAVVLLSRRHDSPYA